MSEPKPMPSYWALAEEVTHLNGQLDQLKAENDKLRKVASIVAYCMQGARGCDRCMVNGGAGKVTEPAGCDGLLDLLRELGVIQ